MAIYEVSFRFRHDCPFSTLSREFPEAVITLWDNFKREFFELRFRERSVGQSIDRSLGAFARAKGSTILRKSSDSSGTRFIVMTCACEKSGSTTDAIMSNNCLFVPPITWHEGWETYRAIGFRAKDLASMFKTFDARGDVKIVSKKAMQADSLQSLFLISLPDLFSNLTGRQLSALSASVEYGYYRNPRQTSTGKIAKALRVPRTTLQEHRRKAESKLMSALAPYLLTYSSGGH